MFHTWNPQVTIPNTVMTISNIRVVIDDASVRNQVVTPNAPVITANKPRKNPTRLVL